MKKKIIKFLPFILIFLFAYIVRILSSYPSNTIIGFDQARDLFDAKKIISGDLRIVGPTAGNNANLHHGVAFLYYIIPPIVIGRSNPLVIVIWNSFFNSLTCLSLAYISYLLFKNKKASIITAFLTSVSFYFVQYSGWLSNPTATHFTVPLTILGLLLYKEKRQWGLPLSLFFLGLSIQFEIFFLYLIPLYLLFWIVLKIKIPKIKTIIFSFVSFCLATSTMIATEIKFKFSGVRSLISSGSNQQNIRNQYLKEFLGRYAKTFSETILPHSLNIGIVILFLLLGYLIFEYYKNSKGKKDNTPFIFALLYLVSPFILFSIGYHKAPWYLIGLPPAIILLSGIFLSKLKYILLIPILILITFGNIFSIRQSFNKGQILLEPDQSAILSKQIEVIKYTYQKSKMKPFSINTVTNPLYINAVWAYNYEWISNQFGYKPTWLGGDQEYPFNTLEKPKGNEELFFLIIDNSGRIPIVHILEAEKWAEKNGKIIEKKDFGGILVNTYSF